MTNRRVKTKPGVDEDQKRKNRTKSRVRAKVEWPFRILKRVFGYTKVRYRGIVKNHHWHLAAFALVNLLPTSQAADSAVGPAGGVVSPGAGKRLPQTQNAVAQSTFTLEIAAGMRNCSRKTASNLQHGEYQDLIRGSIGGGGINFMVNTGQAQDLRLGEGVSPPCSVLIVRQRRDIFRKPPPGAPISGVSEMGGCLPDGGAGSWFPRSSAVADRGGRGLGHPASFFLRQG